MEKFQKEKRKIYQKIKTLKNKILKRKEKKKEE